MTAEEPGIGKDTLLEPVKQAVGPWNFAEVSPAACFSQFNPFAKSVVLRVSEARDLGDHDRYGFYDHMKVYEAAPPDVLRVNEKHMREYYAFNVCRVVYTTNNKTTGLYLPAEDRRHLVDWSEKIKDEFDEAYWDNFWHRYICEGGYGHVAAFLMERDLSRFNPKAPPRKTNAFWSIVDANRSPEEGELADALDALAATLDKDKHKQPQEMSPDKWPDAVTVMDIRRCANGDLQEWLYDRNNRRRNSPPHGKDRLRASTQSRRPGRRVEDEEVQRSPHGLREENPAARQTAGSGEQAGRGRDGRKGEGRS